MGCANRTTTLLDELSPDRSGELAETIDVMLDVLIERMGAMRPQVSDAEAGRRYATLRLGVAFLLGLRDRVVL